MRKILNYTFGKDERSIFVQDEDNGHIIEYDHLPKAKFVKYFAGGNAYVIRNYYYHEDSNIIISVSKQNAIKDCVNLREDNSGCYQYTLTEMIDKVTPIFGFMVGKSDKHRSILEKSNIIKNSFRLGTWCRNANNWSSELNDLPKLMLAIIDYKANKYGIDLSVNYDHKSDKEYPVKCKSDEDAAMFQMYFQDFL